MSHQIVKRNKRYYELTSRNIALIPTNKAVHKRPQLWFSLTKNVTNYNTLMHIMHMCDKVTIYSRNCYIIYFSENIITTGYHILSAFWSLLYIITTFEKSKLILLLRYIFVFYFIIQLLCIFAFYVLLYNLFFFFRFTVRVGYSKRRLWRIFFLYVHSHWLTNLRFKTWVLLFVPKKKSTYANIISIS